MIDILIAEDDLLTRIGISSILNAYPDKYRIIGQADNGRDALTLCRHHKPHVVLTDVRMPVMDGLELISSLKNEGFSCRLIILSAYNDFAYAREGMRLGADDYLLKLDLNPEQLCSAIDRAVSKLHLSSEVNNNKKPSPGNPSNGEQLFAYHAFTREYSADDELKRFGHEINFSNFPEHFFCLLIERPMDSDPCGSADSSFSSAVEILQNLLYNYNIKIFFSCIIDINIAGFTIFPNSGDTLPAGMTAEITAYFTNTFNMKMQVYISPQYHQLCQISRFFLRNFRRSGKHYISTESDQNLLQTDSFKSELSLISAALNDGSIRDILDSFDKLLEKIHRTHACTPKMLHGICHLLIHFTDEYMSKRPESTAFWKRSDQTLRLIKDCNTTADYIDYIVSLKEMFRTLQAHLKEPAFIRIAKDYIKQNFSQNLKVEDIANQVHVSANYLSKSFSSITGEPIIEYINRQRIQAAKTLLIETDQTIYQISEAVGYNSSYYFCRIFKRMTGITPMQYRNRTNT